MSGAPGFWIGNVIVMAGVPSIMQVMPDEVAFKLKSAFPCSRRRVPQHFAAICATRSRAPRGPAVGYGPHRTIYLTGIAANGKVARASARRRFRVLS